MRTRTVFSALFLLLPLCGCSEPAHHAMNWDSFDYASNFCAGNPAECNKTDDSLSSVGAGPGGAKGR